MDDGVLVEGSPAAFRWRTTLSRGGERQSGFMSPGWSQSSLRERPPADRWTSTHTPGIGARTTSGIGQAATGGVARIDAVDLEGAAVDAQMAAAVVGRAHEVDDGAVDHRRAMTVPVAVVDVGDLVAPAADERRGAGASAGSRLCGTALEDWASTAVPPEADRSRGA